MKLTEKVSYLQGMMDGLGLDDSTKEGKVLLQMSEILTEMAHAVEDIQDEVDEVTELVEVIDQDLSDVEDFLEEDEDEDGCSCGCEDDDEEFDFDDEDLYEVTCPSCGDTICLNEDMLEEGSIDCPNCGENLEFDFEPDEPGEPESKE